MKLKRIIFSLVAIILPTSVNAALITIDFQQLAHADSFTTPTPNNVQYIEEGFLLDALTGTFATYGTQYTPGYSGSTALFNNSFNGVTQLSKSGGGIFNLLSIDLAKLGSPGPVYVTFTTNHGDTQTFNPTTINPATTFSFNPSFQGITSVAWTQLSPSHQFDNIVVSTVPVPAAILLFGSGLIGLFGLARSKY